jgi:hypothetical protein
MTIHVPQSSSLIQIPDPNSTSPILLIMTLDAAVNGFTLNENLMIRNPKTKVPSETRFRMINCLVDVTDPAGTAINYVDENGSQAMYYAFYSGWHIIQGWGIVSLAAGVDATRFQVGI